jgi:hypothetical protein
MDSKRNGSWWISALLGIVAGVGSTFLVSWLRPPREPAAGSSRPSSTGTALRPADEGELGRLRAIESRLNRLETHNEADAGPLAQGRAADSERADAPVDPAAQAAEEHEKFHGYLKDHAREPLDATWARSATGSFQGDLAELGTDKGFRVLNVDCRSSSCVGLLEWPSFDQAIKNYVSVVHQRYGLNCARGMSLDEPSDRSAPYQASVLFMCNESGARIQ